MHIQGSAIVHGPQAINSPHRTQSPQQAASNNRATGVDQVDISQEADVVSRVRDLPEIRAERVAEIRSAIDAGVYETDEKLDVALERLLEEIGG